MRIRYVKVGALAVAACALALMPAGATGVVVEELCFDRSAGFPDASGMMLRGAARVLPAGTLRLTPASPSQAGNAFAEQELNLTSNLGFDSTFEFRMHGRGGVGDEDGAGADGIAFIFVNAPSPTAGGIGGGIGYNGLANSLAIEFDTYRNTDLGDPDGDHISIHTLGTQPNSVHESASLGRFSPDGLMADGQVHTARIQYLPPGVGDAPGLTVFYDGTKVLHVAVDLAQTLNLNAGNGYVGLSAATGGGWEAHDILTWKACTSDGREPVSQAEDDAYGTAEDTPLAVAAPGVLGNDTASGGPIALTVVGGPSHGTLDVAGDGSFDYVPAQDFAGTDSFEYRLCAGTTCDVATVEIAVEEVTSADASDDAYTTDEDVPLHVDAPGVLGNDTTVGRPPAVTVATAPAHGTLALQDDGSFSYLPAKDFAGTDVFEYRLCAGTSCDVALVEITLNEVSVDSELAANPAVATALPGLTTWLKLSARLTAGGAPQAGQTIRFVVGSATACSATTGADGVASCGGTVPILLATVLQLGYVAHFDGSPDLHPATDRGPIVELGGTRLP